MEEIIMKTAKFRVWNGMEMVYDITSGKYGTFYVNPEKGDGLNPQDTASLTVNTTKYPDGTPVMMWTWCVEDNKVEIYAGDILKITDEDGNITFTEVRWYQGSLIVEGDFGDYDITTVPWALEEWHEMDCKVEIAGNIYTTPELLPK